MRGDSSVFKGDTYIEIANVYQVTCLSDPASFASALAATEKYVRSKIAKGKGGEVGASGGKLERLEQKYGHKGFHDIFYLTRLHLHLPPSSLCLPPPSKSVRAELLKAGFRLPDYILDGDTAGRGRPRSVKDLSRSSSRNSTPLLSPRTPYTESSSQGRVEEAHVETSFARLPPLGSVEARSGDLPAVQDDRAAGTRSLYQALRAAADRCAALSGSNTSLDSDGQSTTLARSNPIISSRPLINPPSRWSSDTVPHGQLTVNSGPVDFSIQMPLPSYDQSTAPHPTPRFQRVYESVSSDSAQESTDDWYTSTRDSLMSVATAVSMASTASSTCITGTRLEPYSAATATSSSRSTGPSSLEAGDTGRMVDTPRLGIRQSDGNHHTGESEMLRSVMMDFERFKEGMRGPAAPVRTGARTPPPRYTRVAEV